MIFESLSRINLMTFLQELDLTGFRLFFHMEPMVIDYTEVVVYYCNTEL